MVETARCPRCGSTNRLDPRKATHGRKPACGRCGAALGPRSKVVEVSDARFEGQVLASPLPVLLEVWAAWCVPCRGLEPVIEDLATSLAGRVRVARLNVDQSPVTAARLRIQGVPTLVVFKDGHEVARMVGARPKADILRALSSVA